MKRVLSTILVVPFLSASQSVLQPYENDARSSANQHSYIEKNNNSLDKQKNAIVKQDADNNEMVQKYINGAFSGRALSDEEVAEKIKAYDKQRSSLTKNQQALLNEVLSKLQTNIEKLKVLEGWIGPL